MRLAVGVLVALAVGAGVGWCLEVAIGGSAGNVAAAAGGVVVGAAAGRRVRR